MICIITTPIDLGKYVEVWNLKQRFPNERVCHISWADLSQVQHPISRVRPQAAPRKPLTVTKSSRVRCAYSG